MNVFIHELRAYRKSTITWALSMASTVSFLLLLYPTFSNSVEEIKGLLEGFPPEVLRAFGLSPEMMSFFLGFYSFIFLYINLCGAIQAMNLGTSLVAKETTGKTADFVLTKPISRCRIISSKLMAGLTSLLITDVVFMITTLIMASVVESETYDIKRFILISLTLLFIQLIFFAMGFLVSVLATRIKSVNAVSMGTVFAFFIISMLHAALEEEKLRYLTPFDYFDTSYIIRYASYESVFLMISAAFFTMAITASYVVYSKKDIHAM